MVASMFRTVVAGTDGSPRAAKVLQEAIDLCKSQDARLFLVAAFGEHERHWESIPSSREVANVDLRAVAESVLMRAARTAEEQGLEVGWEAREGSAAEAIIDTAVSEKADAIVIGNKGMTGRGRFLLGSVPDKIAHHAPCSVIIVNTDSA
jgi:nucleotide-binding universal stress UspA family protein